MKKIVIVLVFVVILSGYSVTDPVSLKAEKNNVSKTKLISESSDDWPMFQHDLGHTGYSTSKAPNTNNVLWSYQTNGRAWSSPTTANGRVFIGSGDGRLYCLDESDGSLIWFYDIPGDGEIFMGETNGGTLWGNFIYYPEFSAVANGKVFIATGDINFNKGKICVLDEETGILLWEKETDPLARSAPVVAGGRVYVCSWEGNFYCFDENTGTKLWNRTLPQYVEGTVVGAPAVIGDRVFIHSPKAALCCFNATSGGLVWKKSYVVNYECSPTIADERIFVSFDESISPEKDRVRCLNLTNGEVIWETVVDSWVRSSPAVAYGKVFLCGCGDYWGTGKGRIYCLDENTGDITWSCPVPDIYESPAVADGKVYAGCYDGKVVCVNAYNGTLLWTYQTGDWIHSSPAIAYGKLFIGSGDGKVYCFSDKRTSKTLYVGPYPDNYTKIQDAIDNCSDGDTVFVCSGTYYENIIINKTVNLIGENRETTVINGSGHGNVIFVNVSKVKIEGFTVTYAGFNMSDNGIELYYPSHNSIITNCTISKNYNGVYFYYSSDNTFINCNILDNWYGIRLDFSSNNKITICNISDNKVYGIYSSSSSGSNVISDSILSGNHRKGVYLFQSPNTTIENCQISDSHYGIHIFWHSENILITGGEVSNTAWGIYFELSSYNILSDTKAFSNSVNGIYFKASSHNIVTNCEIFSNSREGIELDDSSYNNTITQSTIVDNGGAGIRLSSRNRIQHCNILRNAGCGITLNSASNDTIVSSSVCSNGNTGIWLKDSSNNRIAHCHISNNTGGEGGYMGGHGIAIEGASSNMIENNLISSNRKSGIFIRASLYNSITKCDIAGNGEYGVDFSNAGVYVNKPVNNNSVWLNNFVNNTNNAIDKCSNYWDDGSEGNYWDDYTGTDINNDGIGDIPYNISGSNNKDCYPLMKPLNITVEAENAPPLASFSYCPEAPKTFEAIQFADYSIDIDGNIVSWYWDFGDGTYSNLQNPTHEYPNDGFYYVTLTVEDDMGATKSVARKVTVSNRAPIANFTFSPEELRYEEIVYFNDSSIDLDGSIVFWLWDFGDGSSSIEKCPTHKYSLPGNYTIKLIVVDDDGTNSSLVKSITVLGGEEEPQAPEGVELERFVFTYWIAVSVILIAEIIIGVVFILRKKRKVKEKEKKAVVERPRLKLRCIQCKKTFTVEVQERPFPVKCPHCGKEGVLR